MWVVREELPGGLEHLQFFRFRSAIEIQPGIGERGGFFWLTDAIRLIDVTEKMVIEESLYIGLAGKGLFSYETVRGLDWSDYRFLAKKSMEIVKKLYGAPDAE